MKYSVFFILFCSCLLSCNQIERELMPNNEAKNGNKPVGKTIGYFYDNFYIAKSSNKSYFAMLTHINLSFINPKIEYNSTRKQEEIVLDKDGDVILSFNDNGKNDRYTDADIRRVVSFLKTEKLSIFLSLGGYAASSNTLYPSYKYLLKTPTQRKSLINGIKKMLNLYGLDGVDIDLEYNSLNLTGLNEFIQEIATSFKKDGKKITAALEYKYPKGVHSNNSAWAGKKVLGDFISNTSLNSLDWVNVMSYDYNAKDDNYSVNTKNHSPFEIMERDYNYWNNRGVSPAKIIIGIPFYGKKEYSTGGEYINQNYNSTSLASDESNGYYFNGYNTLKNKTKFVNAKKAGGIMFWRIENDNYTNPNKSLLNAIFTELN